MKPKQEPKPVSQQPHDIEEWTALLLLELEQSSQITRGPARKDTSGLFTSMAEQLKKVHII